MDFLIFSIIGLSRSQGLTTPKATVYYEELLMTACVSGPFSCKRPTWSSCWSCLISIISRSHCLSKTSSSVFCVCFLIRTSWSLPEICWCFPFYRKITIIYMVKKNSIGRSNAWHLWSIVSLVYNPVGSVLHSFIWRVISKKQIILRAQDPLCYVKKTQI